MRRLLAFSLLALAPLLSAPSPLSAQPLPAAAQRLNAQRARALTLRYEDGAAVQCRAGLCASPRLDVATGALNAALQGGAEVRSCYSLPPEALKRLMDRAAKHSGRLAPDLTQCFRLTLPEGASAAQLQTLTDALRKSPGVAEVQPAARFVRPPAVTPDLSVEQWNIAQNERGGHGFAALWDALPQRGEDVRVVDVEVNFNAEHEDLTTSRGAKTWPGCGTPVDFGPEYNLYYTDHGTASLGMIVAQHNGLGVHGFAPAAEPIFCSEYTEEHGYDHGGAILRVLDNLRPGDVVLLEAQTPGPNYNYDDPESQDGLVPIEYNRPEFDAIKTATDLGIIIVEAGGNGAEDLDDPIYRGRFDRGAWDSGAIVVCAGNPPSGAFGPARAAQYYTNYGARCDLQAYGAELYSTGYGDAFRDGDDANRFYTAEFGGTSGASPQIAGAITLLQSIAKARGGLLNPATALGLLQRTGQAQSGGKLIGPALNVYSAALAIDAWLDGESPQEPGLGEPCEDTCQEGLVCRDLHGDGLRCAALCEPFAEDASTCPSGLACLLLASGEGFCAEQGPGHAGSACQSQADCGANLLCIEGNTCAPACSLQRSQGCLDGDDLCYPLGEDWGDIGLCLVISSNPDGLPDGAACTQANDCQSGLCDTSLPDGYCFGLGCQSDADCHDGLCLPGDIPQANTCYGACGAHADCRPEHACVDNICYPGPRRGCLADVDCDTDQRCSEESCVNIEAETPTPNNDPPAFLDDDAPSASNTRTSCAVAPASSPLPALLLGALLLGALRWRAR